MYVQRFIYKNKKLKQKEMIKYSMMECYRSYKNHGFD